MASSNNSTFSVIGSDIQIKGNITASADLHVDGSIEGDIKCASLVQGEASHVTGGIHADTARLAGRVTGSINAKELVILKSAKIEGDVHYDALTIEQGAHVDGRFAPNSRRDSVSKPAATQATSGSKPVEAPKQGQSELKIAN
ncbi:polymer-forming cytoskeletal protein [Erythrobacter sp. THAF29]|uniref:bactofilin family protein n=1 Tax=Erythrobacter sp. THAF29 TaxID=2587851 RepID=UPI00126807FF|nr:polymer-forming cytoskeletal protein [Erythrobacter sp. THAF29]QFT76333.1 Polymer-forming cytoskeletal [Erythrobacter sp. THAF29]